MNDTNMFIEFLINKIDGTNKIAKESTSDESPYNMGDTDGHTITDKQIEALEYEADFLNKIPLSKHEQYAYLICKTIDEYNMQKILGSSPPFDAYKEYRTKEPNKKRKSILTKIENLREELPSWREKYLKDDEDCLMSETEIDDCINSSKHYTLVSLLDELAIHLESGSVEDEDIAPYAMFYPPKKISKSNTLKPLFEKIAKDFNLHGHSLDIQTLVINLSAY